MASFFLKARKTEIPLKVHQYLNCPCSDVRSTLPDILMSDPHCLIFLCEDLRCLMFFTWMTYTELCFDVGSTLPNIFLLESKLPEYVSCRHGITEIMFKAA